LGAELTDTADEALAMTCVLDKAFAGIVARAAEVAASDEQWTRLVASIELSALSEENRLVP
jgi:hypothetical protein